MDSVGSLWPKYSKFLDYHRQVQTGVVKRLRNSRLNKCFEVLSFSDRRKVVGACILQSMLSILDLIGVAIVGILGSLAVTGIQSNSPGERVGKTLQILGIDSLSFQQQVAVLGLSATAFLMARTIFSIVLSRKILFFISRRGSVISTELASKLFSKGLMELRRRSTQQNLYAVTTGVQNVTLGVIGAGIILVADVSLLIVLLIGLLVVDVIVAISALLIFTAVGILLYITMHKKTAKLSQENMMYAVEGAETVIELIENFREYFVRNRRGVLISRFGTNRSLLSERLAELSFMPTLSKYIVESSVLFSALIISAIQFSLQDASRAVATLAIFMAAGSRIAPAALRLQQGLISIKGNLASSTLTLDLITESKGWDLLPEVNYNFDKEYIGFIPKIEIRSLNFSYPDRFEEVLSGVNLELGSGEFLAVVGKSGAGKSTLIDALLGLVVPQHGSVLISNVGPKDCLMNWPGAVAYVPQETHILNGSLRSNICLGYKDGEFKDSEILDAIQSAQLFDFLSGLDDGLETLVGEYGVGLSGGQRQRLGIARALLTKPKLMILDEATSSLDAQTESEITQAIYNLKGSVTVVLIAHRLSTARNADKVAYLSNGKIEALGSFEEVRQLVPDFDTQAKLMGL
jgi:ABC-type multidrug transport system fused ATPase/permease subunit